MSTATALQELLDFTRQNNEKKYVDLKDLSMDNEGLLVLPERKYELSYVAMNGLSKMTGIPPKYFREMPADLRAVNFNYWSARSDVKAFLSITGDIVSEVRNADNEWSVQELIQIALNTIGEDALVIQPYLAQKMLTFYAFKEQTKDTAIGEVATGLVYYTTVNKGGWCYVNPIFVNPLDETVCEIDISQKIQDAEIDPLDLNAVAEYASNEGIDFAERILEKNANDELEDSQHFVSRYGSQVGLATKSKQLVLEEVTLDADDNAGSVAAAVMMAESRTGSFLQFRKMAKLAGYAFFAIDPEYCDHCHQELPEKEMTDGEEL